MLTQNQLENLNKPLFSSSEMPQVSVIIPTYNSSRYIAQALESVFNQNYDSYEIIVVDDGSTDDTPKVLEPYHGRICYIRQENAGSAAARNKGLDLARGQFIVFLDADDLLLPGKLKEQSAYLQLRPYLGLVHSSWQIIDENGSIIKVVEPWHDAPILDLETWLRRKPVKMGAMMFQRVWLESVGGLDPTIRQSHDVDLLLRLSLAGCRAEWMYRPTMCYRHHQESTIRRNAIKQADYVTMVLDKFFAHPQVPDEIRQIENKTRYYSTMWLAWHLFRSGLFLETVEYLKLTFANARFDRIQTVFDWLKHFAKWSAADGAEVESIKKMWPSFQEAANISGAEWERLVQFLDWWLARWPVPDQWDDPHVVWLLFQKFAQREEEVPVTIDLMLAWWVKVWLFYSKKDYAQGAEALHDFLHLNPATLLSVMQFSIIIAPHEISPARLEQLWQDARNCHLIPDANYGDLTALHLTYAGQAAMGRHWKKARYGLAKALRMGFSPRARSAWRQFLQAGFSYYRNGR